MFFAKNARKMVRAALIAAVYVVLCLVFSPISYGPVQVRIAEMLTLLPVFCPGAVAGVTLGCFLANMLSGSIVDMVVGTSATLLAALATYKLRNLRWKNLALLASVPPVLFNAVIVGIELTVLFNGARSPAGVYLFNMATVGLGQLVSCSVLGVALVWLLEKNTAVKRMLTT